jgi:general secretion pathway protein D
VFFNRFGKHPSSIPARSEKTAPTPKAFNRASSKKDDNTRRRALALAMAVQLGLPMGLVNRLASTRAATPVGTTKSGKTMTAGKSSFEMLFGCKADALPTLSPSAGATADAYNSALELLRTGNYDQASDKLKAISVDSLGDADSKMVSDIRIKAQVAAEEQRAGRDEYVKGSSASAEHNYAQAALHFRKVVRNDFTDAHVREVAGSELSFVTAQLAAAGVPQPIHADVVAPGTLVAQATQTDATATAPATPAAPAPAAAAPATPAPAPATPAPAAPAPAPEATAAPAPVAPAAPAGTPEEAAAADALARAAAVKAIQQQKAVYDASVLVKKAREEQAAGQMQEALKDYTEASRIDPANQQAVAGMNEVGTETGAITTGRSGGAAQMVAIQEKRQKIQYEFDSYIAEANGDIDAAKFVEAQKAINNAQVASRNDPTLFQQSEMNNFNTIIEQTEVRLQKVKADSDEKNAEQAAEDSRKKQDEREQEFQRDKERTIANLIQDSRNYIDEGKFPEALAVIDNIKKLDPTNAYVGSVRQFVQDKANIMEQRKWREMFDDQWTKQLNDANERKIPYDDLVAYPPDWPKIAEMRDKEVADERGDDTEDATLQALMDKRLPELRFNANGLSDVIDFLRDVTGANIYVDWAALERASIAKDAPITARLRDIKFSKALEIIFKSVEGDDDDHRLGYTLDEGVILITTRKELNKNVVTRRYDINDLLFVPQDAANAPNLQLQNAGQNQTGGGGGGAGGGGGGGGGGGNLIQDNNNNNNQSSQQQTQDRAARVDEIKKYITDNVDTNTWKDNGGDTGSISSSPLRAVLLITQTPEAHRKIQSVLDSLRASQALQVSIETRFLTVQRNYLQDIGINADFEFNPLQNPANSRSGYNSSRFQPISITQQQVSDNTTFRDANGNVVPNGATGSRTLDWISNVGNAAVPGSIAANTADYPNPLVVSGSYVDNMTVTFLIRAVEANVNTTSLTAPRLTLFSGQRATILVETQQAYVSGLTPVVATGAALFDPTVSTTTATGVVLTVQATVSPDRKYVYMNLQPQLARLRALVPFSISAVVNNTNNIIGGAANTQIITGTLQLPTIDITTVTTAASVPDGATLLLGGQTLAAETTREQGVPVLSKIPFLKRLFTNRATAQDEQILLILVKPTILIQREQELKAFPSLSSKVGG